MLEAPADTRHRDAIRRAHDARGAALAALWQALFPRRS